jgi:hypothetical protein
MRYPYGESGIVIEEVCLLGYKAIFRNKPAQREGSSKQSSAVCSSETSINFQRTTLFYIPEDKTLHNHGCENIISDIVIVCIIFNINVLKEM